MKEKTQTLYYTHFRPFFIFCFFVCKDAEVKGRLSVELWQSRQSRGGHRVSKGSTTQWQ